jgi:DNA modification methylase
MSWNRIITGDCLDVLPKVPAKSVQCCVTSPPYYGLRDYGVEGQLGAEKVPDCLGWATGSPCGECFVCHMVQVFRQVWRVLRDDGVLFLNLGDTYCTKAGKGDNAPQTKWKKGATYPNGAPHRCAELEGFKPKDRIGIPHRVAFALQADGWYWRDEVVWDKVNPMPQSATDRCSGVHEIVFMFSKRERYFYDWKAIEETATQKGRVRSDPVGGNKYIEGVKHSNGSVFEGSDNRRKRSVWSIASHPLKEKHFAAFPPRLVEVCVRAGTSQKGCCRKCGAPVVRVLEKTRVATRPGLDSKVFGGPNSQFRVSKDPRHQEEWDGKEVGNRDPQRHVTGTKTIGWKAGCDCGEGTVPCIVLDMFSGAGTTCLVAKQLGRRYLGIELNPDYVAMSNRRINGAAPRLV